MASKAKVEGLAQYSNDGTSALAEPYVGSLWPCVQTGAPVRIEAVDAERIRYRYVVAGTRSYVWTHDEFLQMFCYAPPLDEILRRYRGGK